MTRTILIAGGTGMFGSKVARASLDRDARLRLLLRPGSGSHALTELTSAGAETMEGARRRRHHRLRRQ